MAKNKKSRKKQKHGNHVTMARVWDRLVAKENEYPAGLKREFPELKYAIIGKLARSNPSNLSKTMKPFIDEVMDRVPRVFTALRRAVEANQDSDYIMYLTELLETDLRNACFLSLRTIDTVFLLLCSYDDDLRKRASVITFHNHDWFEIVKNEFHNVNDILCRYSNRYYAIDTNYEGIKYFNAHILQEVSYEVAHRVPLLFAALFNALKDNKSQVKEIMDILEKDLRDMCFVIHLGMKAWIKAF